MWGTFITVQTTWSSGGGVYSSAVEFVALNKTNTAALYGSHPTTHKCSLTQIIIMLKPPQKPQAAQSTSRTMQVEAVQKQMKEILLHLLQHLHL